MKKTILFFEGTEKMMQSRVQKITNINSKRSRQEMEKTKKEKLKNEKEETELFFNHF